MQVSPSLSVSAQSPDEVRVLVVEDHEATLYAHNALLRHRGYSVAEAGTAHLALDTADNFQPHCVLLDLGLPDMLGTDVARHLRQTLGPQLVVIAVTGIDDSEIHDLPEVSGVDFVMRKPLDIDKIMRILPVVGPNRSQ